MNDSTAVTGTTPADAITRLTRHPSRAVREDARILRHELESVALTAALTAPADSQPDCEHDYVYVSRSEDYYRCDKCDQTSKDGVHPRIGNFDPHKTAEGPT